MKKEETSSLEVKYIYEMQPIDIWDNWTQIEDFEFTGTDTEREIKLTQKKLDNQEFQVFESFIYYIRRYFNWTPLNTRGYDIYYRYFGEKLLIALKKEENGTTLVGSTSHLTKYILYKISSFTDTANKWYIKDDKLIDFGAVDFSINKMYTYKNAQ